MSALGEWGKVDSKGKLVVVWTREQRTYFDITFELFEWQYNYIWLSKFNIILNNLKMQFSLIL